MHRRWLVASVLAAPLLAPAAAVAGAPLPAIAQYVETMPTAGGSVIQGAVKPHVKKLPPRIATRIAARGGRDAPAIEAIATSAAYGAPQTVLARPAADAPESRSAPLASTGSAAPKAKAAGTTTTPAGGAAAPTGPAPAALSIPGTEIVSTDGSVGQRVPILLASLMLLTVVLVVAGRRLGSDA